MPSVPSKNFVCSKQKLQGVSVVTPAFNAAHSIERTVRSVAQQTYKVLEHLVIDDGSKDDTLSILRLLEKEIPHLNIIETNANLGAGQARNQGIEVANGKYIAFLDSDDFWADDKLACQIGFMEKHSVPFSYGDYLVVDEDATEIKGKLLAPEALDYNRLLYGCPVGCLTAAYNQEVLGKLFMPNIRRGQDWGLWLKIMRNANEARKYPGVKAVYMYRKKSLSRGKAKKFMDMYKIYRQENLSRLKSVKYLAAHSISVLRKRPVSASPQEIAWVTERLEAK